MVKYVVLSEIRETSSVRYIASIQYKNVSKYFHCASKKDKTRAAIKAQTSIR